MSKIRIITDSASDISTAEEQKYNILILPFPITIGDKSYMSRVDFDNAGFYKLMEENPNELPKTAQITAFQFDELYKEQFDAGYTDIIFVSINKKGSATHDNAVMAKNEFFEEHPEYAGKGTIQIFDGVGYSGQYGYPVVQAAKMAEEGKTVDEITAYLSDILPKQRIYFGIYGLKYAAKSGRIPSAAALVGDALGVKPIMKIWANEIVTAFKCRGEKKLLAKMADVSAAEMLPGSPYQIVYGCDDVCRDELAAKMTEKVGYAPDDFFQIGAAVASNAGPKVAGVIFTVKDEA